MTQSTGFDYNSESSDPVPYAYLLAGSRPCAVEADYYVCPESFGVERAIFSWNDEARTALTLDLISFERILPVWQAILQIKEEFVS